MGSKKKGSRTERELFDMFWSADWSCVRIAGSGSTPKPSPDLIAGNGKKVLAIECKSTKKDYKYLNKEQVEELKLFSKKFGAEPWIGIRFNNLGWYFLQPKKLRKVKGGNLMVSKELAKKSGLSFKELIK